MRVENVHIESLGVVLHEWADAQQAVAEGKLDAEIQAANGLTGTHVAGDVPAMDMAVQAARTALDRSKIDPEDLGAHIHSAVHYQGPDGAYPPGYILRELGLGTIPALYLQQGCDGMLSALEVAIGKLTGAAEAGAVLLTTGENFSSPDTDRWKGFGQAYILGDGAAAALVSDEDGFAAVRSLNSGVLHELERWHRGNGPLLLREGTGAVSDMVERAQQFTDRMPLSETMEKLTLFDLDIIHRSLVDSRPERLRPRQGGADQHGRQDDRVLDHDAAGPADVALQLGLRQGGGTRGRRRCVHHPGAPGAHPRGGPGRPRPAGLPGTGLDLQRGRAHHYRHPALGALNRTLPLSRNRRTAGPDGVLRFCGSGVRLSAPAASASRRRRPPWCGRGPPSS